VLGNKGLLSAPGPVEISFGNSAILQWCGRKQVIGETVLGNEVLGDHPEHLGPDFTGSMEVPPVAGLVESLIR